MFELHAQIETFLVTPLIHGISEWNLFEIEPRKESDLLKHASERASRVGTARESENTDLVARVI